MKIETPILKRLGPVPFWRGTVKCLDELQRIYKRAGDAAERELHRADGGFGTSGKLERKGLS